MIFSGMMIMRKGVLMFGLGKNTQVHIYGGIMDHPEIARRDVQELLEHFKMLEVRESVGDYMERTKQDEDNEIRIIKKVPLIELTI